MKRFRSCAWLPAVVAVIFFSCAQTTNGLNHEQITRIEDSVRILTDSISRYVSEQGPLAWLRYFEDSPDFSMAADGQLVFPTIDSAKRFVTNTLTKTYRSIHLQWSNRRIRPISLQFATIGANYHEDVTYADGKRLSADGYFTGLAHSSNHGWKLQNAHWSSLPAK